MNEPSSVIVGSNDGPKVGSRVVVNKDVVGVFEGLFVGGGVGINEGLMLGDLLGYMLGYIVGCIEGGIEGICDGDSVSQSSGTKPK